jgi:hypothetical protein
MTDATNSAAGSALPADTSQTPSPAPVELKDPRLDIWNTPTEEEIEAYEAQEANKAKNGDQPPAPKAADGEEPPKEPSDDDQEADGPLDSLKKRLQRAFHRGDRHKRERNEARETARAAQEEARAAKAEAERLRKLLENRPDTSTLDYDEREDLRIERAINRSRLGNVEAHERAATQRAQDAERAAREADELAEQISVQDETRERVTKAADKYPGLWEKLTARSDDGKGFKVVVTPEMARAIHRSDRTVEIIHALVSDPELASTIAQMDTVGQIAAIGELSGRISIAARRLSNTPPPATRLRGGKAPSAMSLDELANDDSPQAMAEYAKRANKAEQERLKR